MTDPKTNAKLARYDADQLAEIAQLAGEALAYIAEQYRNVGAMSDPAWTELVEYVVEHAPPSPIRDRYLADLGLA